MTLAWEVTEDDVFTVLKRHDVAESMDDPKVDQGFEAVSDEYERIIEAVLFYNDLDDQTNAALDVVEDVLIEHEIVAGPKRFAMA